MVLSMRGDGWCFLRFRERTRAASGQFRPSLSVILVPSTPYHNDIFTYFLCCAPDLPLMCLPPCTVLVVVTTGTRALPIVSAVGRNPCRPRRVLFVPSLDPSVQGYVQPDGWRKCRCTRRYGLGQGRAWDATNAKRVILNLRLIKLKIWGTALSCSRFHCHWTL